MGFTVGISNIEMILIKPVIDGSVHIDTDCLGVAPPDFLGLINLVACVYRYVKTLRRWVLICPLTPNVLEYEPISTLINLPCFQSSGSFAESAATIRRQATGAQKYRRSIAKYTTIAHTSGAVGLSGRTKRRSR